VPSGDIGVLTFRLAAIEIRGSILPSQGHNRKVYRSIDELQADLDSWIKEYNEARPHQGRWCFGKTPLQTFLDAMPMTKEKMIAA
jgi:hypothetical protein